MNIRIEQIQDIAIIHDLTVAAFTSKQRSGKGEADLNNLLRANGKLLLSLVAEIDSVVVGHVAFSPARIALERSERAEISDVYVVALGPIAVRPDMQRRGIGSQLILRGFELLSAQGHELVFLLGHTWYYPRFGFVSAKPLGVRWSGDQSDGPNDHFMVKELREGALAERLNGHNGIFYFASEFDEV